MSDPFIAPGIGGLLIEIGSNLGFFLIVCAAFYFCGRFWLDRSPSLSLDRIERFAICVSAGAATYSLFYLFMGICGVLSSISVLLSLIPPFLYSKWKKQIEDQSLKIELRYVLPAALLFIPSFLLALLPELDWDTTTYHLPAIKKFLLDGIISHYPENEPYNFPMSGNLLFMPAIALNQEIVHKLINLMFFILGAYSVFKLGSYFEGKLCGLLAFLIYLGCPIIFRIVNSGQMEPLLASLIAIYFLAKYKFKVISPTAAPIMILLLGFISGIKITGLIFAVAELSLLVYTHIRRVLLEKEKIRKIISVRLITYSILLITPCTWYLKNYLYFSNPLYPKNNPTYFYEPTWSDAPVDLISTARSLLEGRPFKSLPEDRFSRSLDNLEEVCPDSEHIANYGFYELFFNHAVFSRYNYLQEYNLVLWIALIPLWLNSSFVTRMCLAVLPLLAILLLRSHLIRYAVPLFPVLSVLAAVNISRLKSKFEKLKFFKFTSAVLAILICSAGAFYTYYKLFYTLESKLFSDYMSGKMSRMEYLSSVGYGGLAAAKAVYRLNSLAKNNDVKAILIGIGNTNDLIPPVIADYDQVSRLLIPWLKLLVENKGDHAAIYNTLRKIKITHIAINIDYYARQYVNFKYYRENNIWVSKFDFSDDRLLLSALKDLSNFLRVYAELDYDASPAGSFIYSIKHSLLHKKEP